MTSNLVSATQDAKMLGMLKLIVYAIGCNTSCHLLMVVGSCLTIHLSHQNAVACKSDMITWNCKIGNISCNIERAVGMLLELPQHIQQATCLVSNLGLTKISQLCASWIQHSWSSRIRE